MPRGRAIGLSVPLAMLACAKLAGLEDPAPNVDAAAPIEASDVVDAVADGAPPPDAAVDAEVDAGDPYCSANGLVARWRFEDGTGTTVTDCTVHFLDGIANGGPTWVPGKVGTALSFANGQFVDFGNPPALRITGAITVAAWVKVRSASVTNAGRVLSKAGGAGDRGWELNVESDQSMRFRISNDGTTSFEAKATTFPLDTWKHVAGTYEPGVAVRLFVDGTRVDANTTGIPATQRDTLHTVRMGQRPGDAAGDFDGLLDDVRVYKRALTEKEVQALLTL